MRAWLGSERRLAVLTLELVGVARDVDGAELGLVNVARTVDFQLGLVNVADFNVLAGNYGCTH